MNWKNNANLFVNGKFSVEWPASGMATGINGFDKYAHRSGGKVEEAFELADGDIVPVENCTLIARPIADMTNKEISELRSKVPHNITDEDFYMFVAENALPTSQFLHLLSIGVYPFDQSHFETGEVLNINEVTA